MRHIGITSSVHASVRLSFRLSWLAFAGATCVPRNSGSIFCSYIYIYNFVIQKNNFRIKITIFKSFDHDL